MDQETHPIGGPMVTGEFAGHVMTGQEMAAWRLSHGWGPREAAQRLRIALSTVQRYEAGSLAIPHPVALACRYLALMQMVNRWEGVKPDGG